MQRSQAKTLPCNDKQYQSKDTHHIFALVLTHAVYIENDQLFRNAEIKTENKLT